LVFACVAAVCFADGAGSGSIGVFGSLGGTGTVIGATYQVSESIGLRAGFGLDLTSNPDQNAYKSTTVLPFGLKFDCLFELPMASGLSLGVGPSLSFTLDSYRYEYPTYTDTETYAYIGLGALANLQYLFAKNFGAFLDASLTATFMSYRDKSSLSPTATTYATARLSTGTSLGLIFFIK
jgi:hypothetical protein